MFTTRGSLLLSIVLSLAAPVALAQESGDDASDSEGGGDEAARLHFQAGRSHYDNGAYEAALQEFEAAYELSGRPELLYNLYLTVERTGDLDRALDYLERYLAEGAPDATRRGQLERRLANLRERRARIGTDTPPPEEGAGAEAASGGDLVPAAIAFGVAGAGLVSFAVFGGLALAEDGALATGCGATRSCTDAQVSNLMAFDVAADVSWITAAVAAGAGVVLLLTLGLSSDDEEVAAAFVPWAAPGAAGVSSTVRF